MFGLHVFLIHKKIEDNRLKHCFWDENDIRTGENINYEDPDNYIFKLCRKSFVFIQLITPDFFNLEDNNKHWPIKEFNAFIQEKNNPIFFFLLFDKPIEYYKERKGRSISTFFNDHIDRIKDTLFLHCTSHDDIINAVNKMSKSIHSQLESYILSQISKP